MIKLSGGKMFGGNKWDSRTLRIENKELIYLDRGKEKGRVPLEVTRNQIINSSTSSLA